jgi:hypothetical protein
VLDRPIEDRLGLLRQAEGLGVVRVRSAGDVLGIEGLPIVEYISENSPERAARASFTMERIVGSGWSWPTRASKPMYVKSDPDRGPRLNQCAIDREMVRAEQALHARLGQNRAQQLRRDLALQQPVAVLGNVEWSQTASSTPIPTNQRNNRSNSSRSINCRPERIE